MNDCFRPVSRYFDRISRPEQVIPAALQAMRVLASPAETGAVTLALPQDVQAEAFDCPDEFLEKRVWHVPRAAADAECARPRGRDDPQREAAADRCRRRRHLLGGDARRCRRSARRRGSRSARRRRARARCRTTTLRASVRVGVTGTFAANRVAAQADVVIGVGTRYSDFTTASKTAFRNPDVRFVNVNVADFDAAKQSGVRVVADARTALEQLADALAGWSVDDDYRADAARLNREWDDEVARLYSFGREPVPAQSEVIGAVNDAAAPQDVVVCAAGSMPGDLHKLWRTRDPKGYHVEYGYSCMGYEIAGGLGVKLAAPEREVYVLVGDGSYLMLPGELVTAVQEGVKLVVVLVDNHGFNSIGSLARSVGLDGFGTQYRFARNGAPVLDGDEDPPPRLPLDLAANAASLGAEATRVGSIAELREALARARAATKTTVIVVEVDRYEGVPGYESWWDVPVAEISELPAVRQCASRVRGGEGRRAPLPLARCQAPRCLAPIRRTAAPPPPRDRDSGRRETTCAHS